MLQQYLGIETLSISSIVLPESYTHAHNHSYVWGVFIYLSALQDNNEMCENKSGIVSYDSVFSSVGLEV